MCEHTTDPVDSNQAWGGIDRKETSLHLSVRTQLSMTRPQVALIRTPSGMTKKPQVHQTEFFSYSKRRS